jgi:hypothetical protein
LLHPQGGFRSSQVPVDDFRSVIFLLDVSKVGPIL